MFNRSTMREALRPEPGCLTIQELEKLAENSSPTDPHLANCPRCQTELALLKTFESSEPVPGEGAAVAWISARLEQRLDQIKGASPQRRATASDGSGSWLSRLFSQPSTAWLVPVAAALIVVIAIAGARMHRSAEPELRADAGTGTGTGKVIYRSQEIKTSGPSGDLVEAPKTLQWNALIGATAYTVVIMEVDETPLWSGETVDVTITIPDAIRDKMLPRKPALWRVTARDNQGRVLATSQVQRFSVLPKSRSSAGTPPR
jgi:hypothetical protein